MDRWVRLRHLFVALVALASACTPAHQADAPGSVGPQGSAVSADTSAISSEVRSVLREATDAWNRDDLDGYLTAYTDQPTLTYIGADGKLSGKRSLRERLDEAYFSTTGEIDDIAFDELDVMPLGPDRALVTGRWTTYQPGFDSQPLTGRGRFSMILARESAGWRILHEHSS